MSEKSRMRAKQREEKQQKQADRIITGMHKFARELLSITL